MKNFYVYILASGKKRTLHIGMISDLIKRVYQHKNKIIKGFTEKYNFNRLVYYKQTPDPISAITREKQIKKWKREWKINLIELTNPNWEDLCFKLIKCL